MTTTIPDLWPEDFGIPDQVPPIVILREQATLLSQKTKNIIKGHVETNANKDGRFLHEFQLSATALDNYKYTLFYVEQPPSLYPIMIYLGAPGESNGTRCDSEENFLAVLREIFASERTRKIIQALLAQIQK